MNGNKNGGVNKTRTTRTIKVAPTTRAIRLALAASATMLALSGSGVAFAQVCVPTGATETTCSGSFTDTVNAGDEFPAVIDLTLILDDTVTVTPAAGADGVYATWDGNVSVINYADSITTTDATAINVYAYNGDASVSTYGLVVSQAVGANVTTIVAYADDGDVTVVNGGTVIADATGTIYSATGISASSGYSFGLVTVTNTVDGNITVGTTDGAAVGISATTLIFEDGSAIVTNAGDITVGSFGADATGIVIVAEQDATVNNTGSIGVVSQATNATGVDILAYYGVATVTNGGTIDVEAYGTAIGVSAIAVYNSADVDVTNTGVIDVYSTDGSATGVAATAVDYAYIGNSGTIVVLGYTDATGVSVTGYDIDVDNTGSIDVTAIGAGADAAGIDAAAGGSIYIYSNGTINVTSYGDGVGVPLLPYSEGADAVGVSAVSTYYYSEGGGQDETILYGPSDVNVVLGPANVINVNAAGDGTGVYAAALGAGSVYVYNAGIINVDAAGAAMGIEAYSDTGQVYVYNTGGNITVDSSSGDATGISAHSYGNATVENTGTIDVYAYSTTGDSVATGIDAVSYDGNVTVDSTGNISVYAGTHSHTADTAATATGIYVYAYDSAYVTNGGTIDATSYVLGHGGFSGYATSTGIEVGYSYYSATVTNTGSISANASAFSNGDYAEADAVGIDVYSVGDVTVTNSGNISASAIATAYTSTGQADADAFGIDAYSYASDVTVTSTAGTITVNAYAGSALADADSYAIGINAYAYAGYSTVTNGGAIVATAGANTFGAEDADSNATGIDAYGYDGASVTSTGSISSTATAYASTDDADADAWGIIATSGTGGAYGVSVDNGGTITASAYADGTNAIADAYAAGIYGYGYLGVDVVNGGDITVVADGASTLEEAYAYGLGIYAGSYDGAVTVNSSGDITVTTTANGNTGANSGAAGIAAYSYSSVVVDSGGVITVSADATSAAGSADAIAVGIAAASDADGTISVSNGGTIDVSATASGYTTETAAATGILTYTLAGTITVYNEGSISAYSNVGTAYGVSATTDTGDILVDSSGSITTDAYGISVGIFAVTDVADITLINSGTITVDSADSFAVGMYSYVGSDGDSTVTNSGLIDVASVAGPALGISSLSYFYGDSLVTNTGTITVSAYTTATGIYSYAFNGDADVVSSGPITVTSVAGSAYGINADSDGKYYGTESVTVTNSGDITVTADYNATGILGDAKYGVTVYNSGDITVTGGNRAVGIDAYTYSGAIDIYNEGNITATAGSVAVGILSGGYTGTVIVNNGNITVSGGYLAGGIYATDYADMDISNSGNITVYAGTGGYFGGSAIGIHASTPDGDIYVENTGTVSASSYSLSLLAGSAVGIETSTYYGSIDIQNSGSVSASAESYSVYYGATATGVSATSYYGFAIEVDNTGTISASADTTYFSYGGYTSATGISVNGLSNGYISIYNGGDVNATASTTQYSAQATGIYATSTVLTYGLSVANYGDITATATTADYGFDTAAYAVGVNVAVPAYGDIFISNSGDITANATVGDGSDYGSAEAFGVMVYGYSGYFGVVSIYNEGSITANATVGDSTNSFANATGVQVTIGVDGAARIDIENSGTISAAGDDQAIGVAAYNYVYAGYGIEISNSGNITATSDDTAIAIRMHSDVYADVYNEGTISGIGGVDSIAIYSTGLAGNFVDNFGTITGALLMGDGDDYLYNEVGSVWNPLDDTDSDFGLGDDTIVNRGTINMNNSVIDLGYHAVSGNSFYNYGTINVNGTDNVIDMGLGLYTAVPSLNPNAFYNYGTIDFQDGAPNDYLLIVGDFAGDGDINVDVSGLNGTSDILYIDGSVVVSSDVQTINVDLLDLPNSIEAEIPMVYVSGNSVVGDFVLGTVNNFNPNTTFVTIDFTLISDIDATNATPDVFSLGIEVTGLNDPGTLAAAIAPGVQSLMNTQVGTWRQRMGVINQFNKGGVSLWARIFQDKGSFTPEHFAANFGQGGNFDWDQRNSGMEAGVDFAVTDEFSLGLLLAKAQADIDLDPGVGSAELDGDTWGLYGTWISPSGFYVDVSYRWMSFDADLNSVAGPMDIEGDAETFNLEMGYAWTLSGGLKVEPQFQYTKTSVDSLTLLTTSAGMEFQANGGDSSRGRIGVALRKDFGDADGGWMWTPHATLSAVREFDGQNSFAINDTFFGDTTVEGTSGLLELGVTATTGNLSIFGGVNWQDGGAMNSFVGGQLGVRYTFGGSAPAPAPQPLPPAKTCADLDDDGDGVNNCDDKCLGSTAGQAVGPDGCPVPLTIDLKGVNFDFDMSTLRPDAVVILDEAIAILGKYPDLKVEVAGHTDSIGTEEYNQGLSERRAQAVYDYLSSHGIGADRLVGPTGYGETRPLVPNTNEDGSDNPENRARNRRTELNVQN